jgi:hypothetical protein
MEGMYYGYWIMEQKRISDTKTASTNSSTSSLSSNGSGSASRPMQRLSPIIETRPKGHWIYNKVYNIFN